MRKPEREFIAYVLRTTRQQITANKKVANATIDLIAWRIANILIANRTITPEQGKAFEIESNTKGA